MNRWPSFTALFMDLIEGGRAAGGWPSVPVGITFDASVDEMPRYIVSVVDPQAGRLEALPVVDIEVVARTYSEAERLAFDVDEILMGYPLSTSSDGRVVLVDRVDAIASPAELSLEGESKIRRFLATYQASIRRG